MKSNTDLQHLFDRLRQENANKTITTVEQLDQLRASKKPSRYRGILLVFSTIGAVGTLGLMVWLSAPTVQNPSLTTTVDVQTSTASVTQPVPITRFETHTNKQNKPAAGNRALALSAEHTLATTTDRHSPTRNQLTTRALLSASADDEVHVAAIVADEKFFRSLNIEPNALAEICSNLAGADSLTNCSVGSADSKMKVCLYSNGTSDEVVFMDRPGPMPVMFTSASGLGKVVTSRYTDNVDPNKLVPVAAHGCADNVLMWFAPTQEFKYSLPDSLGSNLGRVLEFEAQLDPTLSNTRTRNNNGKNYQVEATYTTDVSDFLPLLAEAADSLGPILDMEMQVFGKSLGDVDTLLSRLRDCVSDSLFRRYVQLVNTANDSVRVTSDSSARWLVRHNIQSDGQRIESRILVIKCGRIDRTTHLPVKNLPIQETRNSHGAFSVQSLYPNPTPDGGVTISFTLDAPRLISAQLTDLSGAELRTLATNVWKNTGSGQLTFSLRDVQAGMYLITLVTDKAERIVQRVIVQ